MPQKATDFIKSMTDLKLDEAMINAALEKGISEGTIEDDRSKSGVPDDIFMKALDAIEKAAKMTATEIEVSKSQAAVEAGAALVDAAVNGSAETDARLSKLEALIAKSQSQIEAIQRMLATALPGIVEVSRATVGALGNFEKSFSSRLDATDAKIAGVRIQAAPKAVSGAYRAAPSPHDEKKAPADVALMKSQIFQKVLAETGSPNTEVGRRNQLIGVIGTLPAVNNLETLTRIASDLGYKDLLG
jgi:hypothetical protein